MGTQAPGAAGWRTGGRQRNFDISAEEQDPEKRSRSPQREVAKETDHLAKKFAEEKKQKEALLAEGKIEPEQKAKTPAQQAKEMMEREKEKARLKKLANQEKKLEEALNKEMAAKAKPKEKFKRY